MADAIFAEFGERVMGAQIEYKCNGMEILQKGQHQELCL